MRYAALVPLLILASCGSSAPVPKVYVLTAPAAPVASVANEAGRPVLLLPRVSVPDYLDTTDMMIRDGQNELRVSQTGRWGERLSVGVTDALDADLQRRLPGYLLVRSGAGARDVDVNVEAFDVRADGNCVLRVRWTVRGPDGDTVLTRQQDTIVTQASGTAQGVSDAAAADVMSAAIDQLAARIAPAVASGRH
jgi:uncharacterized lipoprotein YmbA